MNNLKRGMVAVVAALGLGLTACAPGTPAAPSAPPQQTDDKNLSYVYFTDGPDEQATRDLIAQFEQKTGAKVNLEVVPYANLEQTLQARLAGNNAPDVARVSNLGAFLNDMQDLSSQKAALDGVFLKGIDPFTHGKGGEIIAVPSDLTMNGPLVNVDLFKKAGVELPTADKPWKSWDEMVAAAKKVKEAAGTEFAIAIDVSPHRLSTVFSQYGTTLFKGDGKEVNWDEAKGAAAIAELKKLHDDGSMPKDLFLQAGSKYKAANDIFLAQQVPVYISGNWQVAALSTKAQFEWAAVPNPCQERCGGFPGGKFMIGFKQAKHHELAAEFIAFMNSKEAQEHMAKKANFLPTRNDLVKSGIAYEKRGDDMKVFLGDIAKTPDDTYPTNYSSAFGVTGKEVITQMGLVLQGQAEPAAASAAIKKAAETNAAK